MNSRRPKANHKGFMMLHNYRLVFKGVADIIPSKGFACPVGLWEITEHCERSLDRYEGFPSLYRKEYFWNDNDETLLMAYVMNDYDLSLPSKNYFDTIEQGYRDFSIDDRFLYEAVEFTETYQTDNGYISRSQRANQKAHYF